MFRQVSPVNQNPPTPPAEFRTLVHGGPISEEDHIKIGKAIFEMVKQGCSLTPSSTVLDIGCGCGRIAVPMACYLTSGVYHGVDIVKPMVDWCASQITSRHPNFHFHHADLTNTLYSATGQSNFHFDHADLTNTLDSATGQSAASYVFPFPDKTFDVIFATSVFTHLVKDSAQQYLNEIARMLKPRTGLALLSFFLLSKNRPHRTRNGMLFSCDGYSVIDKDNPEHIVVFEESAIREMMRMAGLKVRVTYLVQPSDDPEDWSGQDTFIVFA